ncbi:MAG: hypothetical protein IJZ51_10175 [Ruminiclostridium sp.]|nr:hypothetical protein [Ruminiclostridium sp.]
MKIKSVALLSALICLLCSCSESPDSSSQTETLYPNSVTNTDSEEASSAVISAQDKNYPDVSKGKKINKFSYIPIGYVDKENRYLLLKLSDNFSKTEYEIYDTVEDVSVHSFVTEDDGQSGTADLRYSDDAFTFANFKYVEDKNFNICYSESYDIFGNMLFKYPESNGDIGISVFNYSLSDNKTYFVLTDNNKEGFYKSDKDGTNVTYISDVTPVDYFILDDEIVYYDVHYEYGKPENDACIFGIMDKEGNLQKQINIGAFTNCNRRLIKAGDYICFMSPFETEILRSFTERSNGVILYNYKTNGFRIQYFDKEIENSYCGITPNGKYLVTCIPDDKPNPKDKSFLRGNTTINIYSAKTGELIKSEALKKEKLMTLQMSVFDEAVIFTTADGTYQYDFTDI